MAVEESNLYPQKEKTRCRICYEVTEEGYPLRGKIPNVDTDIADMLTYCTLVDLDEIESLPTTVCTQCFKTLRIAYIFIKRFKETNEWLVDQLIKKELTDDHMYTKSHNTESSHDTADNDLTTEDMRHSYEQDIIDEELIEPLQEHEEVQQDNQQIQIIQIVAQEQGDVEQFEGENMEEHNTLYMVDTTATDNIITISNYEDFENLTEDTPELEIPDEDDPKADQENEIVYGHQIQQQLISYLNTGSGIKAEGEEKIFINPPKFKFRRRYHKQYVCPKCPDERLTDSEFYHHIVNHGRNRDGMFQCNQCDLAILMNAGEFYEHCMKMHRYHCVICNESFGKRGTHYAHMRRHSNIRYTCSYKGCNKSFITPWSLEKHEHLHTSIERYKCEDCNIGFKTYDTYRYHLKKHKGRKYLCTFCGKSYLQSVHLKYHLWNHSGVKQFKCEQCQKCYTSITVLRKHKRKVHPDT